MSSPPIARISHDGKSESHFRGRFMRSPTLQSGANGDVITIVSRSISNVADVEAGARSAGWPAEETDGRVPSSREPLLGPAPLMSPDDQQAYVAPDANLQSRLNLAYNISWVVNFALFGAKFFAWWISNSQAVLASLVDSLVDIISQIIIFVAELKSKQADARYPVGRARLETIGVLSCACVMTVSAFEVVQNSGIALYQGFFQGMLPDLETGVIMYSVLGVATVLKLICYLYCTVLSGDSDSMVALAEDHLNDIFSNVAAAISAVIASYFAGAWWVDPAGGISISIFIVVRWILIAMSQVDKIVGRGAPREFIDELSAIADGHHDNLTVDCIRAYHFGARFMVEMEVVMPQEYTLKQVHDISLLLQVKLEELADVERAFVHVDYAHRPEPEHRHDRVLQGLPGSASL